MILFDRSPGDPTAGTRARGGSRGGPGQQQGARGSSATRVPPSMGSSRQGGPRGRLPPSGPSSRHQGQLYHQDLAYYDVDSRGGRGTIPLGLEGGQTNDRVMEWMLGVERSGGGEDQRSLSSRGATREAAPQPAQHLRDLRDSRTSPRSKHRQAQHRSMSQERAAMSTSWSGHPAMSALNFQVIVFASHLCPDLSIINPYHRVNLMQKQNEDLVPVCKCLHLQEACRYLAKSCSC